MHSAFSIQSKHQILKMDQIYIIQIFGLHWKIASRSFHTSFIFLLLENYGVRKLEAVFTVLISTRGLSFAWMFADTEPSGKELLIGLLVRKLSSRTIRQAVEVVGCVFAKGFYGIKQGSSIGLVNAGQYLEEKYSGGALPILYICGEIVNICGG